MTVEVQHAAITRAPPELASDVVLAAESLPKWFKGAVVEECDAAWPAAGSHLAWRLGWSRFVATVTDDARPARVVMNVKTPSGVSRVTHSFAPAPGGGSVYEKRVEARLDKSGKLGDLLVRSFLRGSVRREVERAAKLE